MPASVLFLQNATEESGPVALPWLWILIAAGFIVAIIYLAKRIGPGGPTFVGSPQQIIDKMMAERELFGHDRFLGQIDLGGLPYAKVASTVELLAAEVLPVLRSV